MAPPVDQTQLVGALCIDRVAGDEQLQRCARWDQPWKRRRPRRPSPELDLGDGEAGVVGCHDQVAHLGQQEAAGVRHTVDRGDDRLVGVHRAAEVWQEIGRRDSQRRRGHLLEVPTGAEGLVAGPGEDQHGGVLVVAEPLESGPQPLANGSRQRVARLRPVDGEPGDGLISLVADDLLRGRVRHGLGLLQIRSTPPGVRTVGVAETADRAIPRVLRVSRGSISPSSRKFDVRW